MKKCTKCGETKPRSAFHKDGSGVVPHCKTCQALIYAAYRKAHPDKDRASKRRYVEANHERTLLGKANYRNAHREEVRAKGRVYAGEYRRQHPRLVLERTADWRKRNRDQIGAYQNEYTKRRRFVDPSFKMTMALRNRINAVLRSGGAIRTERTETLLGCTIAAFRAHIEAQFRPGMTWENHGEWHIDHIRPCASFDLRDPAQQRQCFHYTNLQPLWAAENMKKGAKMPHEEATAIGATAPER